jgi:hypothetical protein
VAIDDDRVAALASGPAEACTARRRPTELCATQHGRAQRRWMAVDGRERHVTDLVEEKVVASVPGVRP